MSFATTAKKQEFTFIARLLTVFGIVEERQMRQLFKHLPAAKYGRIMTSLYRQGLAYYTPDGKYIATNEFQAARADRKSSVLCFWAFIHIRNQVQDFCAGMAPALVTVAASTTDYDLIPLTDDNIALINEMGEEIPEHTVRYLITDDLHRIVKVNRRIKNDYVLQIQEDGAIESYEM